jgi:FAD/FMN-containing dehydrogenase
MKSIAYLVYIFFLIFAGSAWCYPFSLPGDKNWPTPLNFLDFKKRISGQVSFRGDSDYAPHTWNRLTNTPKPAVIVKPISSNDVIEALKFALTHNIKLSVQSTGHHQDYRNIADNSVHLDMSTMNAKSIDKEKRTLTVGPGNNWRQIHSFVQSQTNSTLIAMSGADPGVGICNHFLKI